jgi:hypothetical protein
MAKDKELTWQVNVKFTDENQVGRNFGFNVSEIVRRSTLEGLKKLERAKISGSPQNNVEAR